MTNWYDVLTAVAVMLPLSVTVIYIVSVWHTLATTRVKTLETEVFSLSVKLTALQTKYEATADKLDKLIESRM